MANQDSYLVLPFDYFDIFLIGTVVVCLGFLILSRFFSKFTHSFLVSSLNTCLWLQELCNASEASDLRSRYLMWVEKFGQKKIENVQPAPFYSCPNCRRLKRKKPVLRYIQYTLLPCGHGVCQACARKSPYSDDMTNICPRCNKEVIWATRLIFS
jgi:hypothetical protein